MADLRDFRTKIDAIDREMTRLFQERLDVSAEIGAFKRARGLPIMDPARELAKLREVCGMVPPERRSYVESLYRSLFALSRAWQRELADEASPLSGQIASALAEGAAFPEAARVSCPKDALGLCRRACEKLFASFDITPFNTAEGALSAAGEGQYRYCLMPLEGEAWELLARGDFHIARIVGPGARVACASKRLEIYPGADKTAIALSLPRDSGALYDVLGRFYALGTRLAGLQTRPLPGGEAPLLAVIELEASVDLPALARAICELSGEGAFCKFLGSYSEVN